MLFSFLRRRIWRTARTWYSSWYGSHTTTSPAWWKPTRRSSSSSSNSSSRGMRGPTATGTTTTRRGRRRRMTTRSGLTRAGIRYNGILITAEFRPFLIIGMQFFLEALWLIFACSAAFFSFFFLNSTPIQVPGPELKVSQSLACWGIVPPPPLPPLLNAVNSLARQLKYMCSTLHYTLHTIGY